MRLFCVWCIVILSLTAKHTMSTSVSPPKWDDDYQCDWYYVDSDGKTILARQDFYMFPQENARVIFGAFDETTTQTDNQLGRPLAGFANFTSKSTIRYYPDFGLFGVAYPCYCEEWNRTYDYDATFNNLGIPDNYTYQGTKSITDWNGKEIKCDAWKFIAINYPESAGNIMYTQVESENSQRPPIRMDILHNGRFIYYVNWFQPPKLSSVFQEYKQFCLNVTNTDGSEGCKKIPPL